MVLFHCNVSCEETCLKMEPTNRFPPQRLLLFMIFFPRRPNLPNNDDTQQYTWRTAVTVACVCLFHGLLVVFVTVGLALTKPGSLGTWAIVLGITATILATIQYLPQIWMTWHLGHVGSLSIPMMLMQTPGSFVWSASLAARYGVSGWSSWGVFLVTGCLQGCLLVMGIYFEVQARLARQGDEGEWVGLFLDLFRGICILIYNRQMADVSLDISQAQMEMKRQMMKGVQLWKMCPVRGHLSSTGPGSLLTVVPK